MYNSGIVKGVYMKSALSDFKGFSGKNYAKGDLFAEYFNPNVIHAVAGITATKSKSKKKRSKDFEKLVGPTDPKIDYQARERLITARIGLLLQLPQQLVKPQDQETMQIIKDILLLSIIIVRLSKLLFLI